MKNIRSIASRLISDDLLRHVGILFSGMMVVHVCNMIFQMAVSRALIEKPEEYALLAAFLAALAIIQRPLGALRTGVSHYTSLLVQDQRVGDVRRFLKKWILLAGGAGLILGLLVVLLNGPLSMIFHLDRVAPVIIGGAVLPALFCLPVLGGVGQGVQIFGWCSASNIIGAFVRLGLGAGFVWFLYPACGWAMLGHGLGIYASIGVLIAGLVITLRNSEHSKTSLPSIRIYLVQSFFVQAAYAILLTADVVLVKHYLPEDTEFAYAATLSRMVVFLPGAISMAMFPKVASRGAGSPEQYGVFIRSLRATALFVSVAVALCCIVPGFFARVLFGISEASVYLRQMIRGMSMVMGVSALLNVTICFAVAQRRFVTLAPIVFFACVYVLFVGMFHSSSWHIVAASGLFNLLALLSVCVLLNGTFMRRVTRRVSLLLRVAIGKDFLIKPDVSCSTKRLGSDYGGWNILEELLDCDSVVYSFGIGQDASFDRGLIDLFGVDVHAFDPTPGSIQWVAEQRFYEKFVMHNVGLAAFDGTVQFNPPANPDHISHSMLARPETESQAIEVPVQCLRTIMMELGHDRVDLLKMDIEGAEYAVITDLARSNIRPVQLLIEFHHRFPSVGPAKTKEAISLIQSFGYFLYFVSDTNEEFCFVRRDVYEASRLSTSTGLDSAGS